MVEWYEAYVLCRKLVLCAGMVFVVPTTITQLAAASAAAAALLVFEGHVAAHETAAETVLSLLSLASIAATTLAGALIKAGAVRTDRIGGGAVLAGGVYALCLGVLLLLAGAYLAALADAVAPGGQAAAWRALVRALSRRRVADEEKAAAVAVAVAVVAVAAEKKMAMAAQYDVDGPDAVRALRALRELDAAIDEAGAEEAELAGGLRAVYDRMRRAAAGWRAGRAVATGGIQEEIAEVQDELRGRR